MGTPEKVPLILGNLHSVAGLEAIVPVGAEGILRRRGRGRPEVALRARLFPRRFMWLFRIYWGPKVVAWESLWTLSPCYVPAYMFCD